MELTLDSPVQYVPRVGPMMAKRLEKLEIRTVRDLIFYPPFRYNDFSMVSPIGHVQPGETVTVKGTVKSIVNLLTKNGKKMQVATVFDDTGKIEVVWFNQTYLLSVIRPNMVLNIAGTVSWFTRKIAIISPDYEILNDLSADNSSLHTGRLVPVYPETAGISSKWLRGRIAYLTEKGLADITDHLPAEITNQYRYPTLSDALKSIHFPDSAESAQNAEKRLGFDELLLLQLIALNKRKIWETTQTAHRLKIDEDKLSQFIKSLPFTLTGDQIKSVEDIKSDIQKSFPMNRLLEGDVGAGKTIVAAAIMYITYLNGLQSVIMAPTQILAHQHYDTLLKLFTPLNINVELVSSETNKSKSKKNPDNSFFQTTDNRQPTTIFVGTHALLSSSVNFDKVGLVIIDEQQRFGVGQRKLLRDKTTGAKTPHLLTMTATPIPRTIALAAYGNLDLSVISQMPQGRQTIKTWVVAKIKRDNAYAWIKKQIIDNNSQAFVVCPLIEESETLTDVASVKKEFERLQNNIFPDLKLALLHGRMKPKEKNEVLVGFRDNKFHILVTTPVVEVGIDIPRASIMMIEASDRFGLSQLHQLRGRVGRRSQQAYCLLFTESDDEKATKRLKYPETVHNGPELSEIDLVIRGPGELFGSHQHGLPHLKFCSIFDIDLLEKGRNAALQLQNQSPDLSRFTLLREKVEKGTIEAATQD